MKLVIAWFTEGSVDTSKTERRDVSWGLLGIFGKNMANCLYSNTFSKDPSISAGERELRRNQMSHTISSELYVIAGSVVVDMTRKLGCYARRRR